MKARLKIIGRRVVAYTAYTVGLVMILEAAAFLDALFAAGFHFSRAMLIYDLNIRDHMTVGQMGAIGAGLGLIIGIFASIEE